MLELLFWTSLFIVFYTYVGYGLVLCILVRIKKAWNRKKTVPMESFEPEVTLLIAAYNEAEFVDKKVDNTAAIDYPAEKLHQLWVTDGSDDGTNIRLYEYENIRVLHQPGRKGKITAISRAMKHVQTPVVIFSDANTLLNAHSVRSIIRYFEDPEVGCVAGEKRIQMQQSDEASSAGEGFYWKYESTLKKWDSELNSIVGAAGELFAIRTDLFQEVEPDTLLDDFIISMRIAMQGYKVRYTSEAYAVETASLNVREELKRKIRISAGGLQSIIRLFPLLNIFRYGLLSFQYISHRVLRWTLAPALLPVLLFLNLRLNSTSPVYSVLLSGQVIFYVLAIAGWILEKQKMKIKALFIPYYFLMMNYAVYRGALRFLVNNQTVNWERAKRK